jgi:hypothetical protein
VAIFADVILTAPGGDPSNPAEVVSGLPLATSALGSRTF